MKKILSVLLISFAVPATVNACEICGCSLGNYYIGLLPHFKHHFIGLRYQYGSFNTRLKDDPNEFSNDRYETLELWAGWNLSRKFQVLAILPYTFNHQVSDAGVTDLQGIGDLAVLVNYQLFSQSSPRFTQQLYAGVGLKLATGSFAIEEGDPDIAAVANTQRGSGSTDILLNLMHHITVGNWGINTTAGYKINSTNREEYHFGNKFTANSFVYYSLQSKKIITSPNLGITYEQSRKSELTGAKIDLTGGSLLMASLGAEFGFGKISVGCNVRLPLTQNFADGQTRSTLKTMAHVSYAF
ncbi:MAG: hypothetical protein GC171_15660 [Terrimonas sp.]|nr:hypothetical protein [Terrimonas sp.]